MKASREEARAVFESGMDGVGVWSSRGEFLGLVSDGYGPPFDGTGGAVQEAVHEAVQEVRTSAALHRFERGGEEGYRVLVRVWEGGVGGEPSSYWVAPTVEDEGYIGMFTEPEARRGFPELFVAREGSGGPDN